MGQPDGQRAWDRHDLAVDILAVASWPLAIHRRHTCRLQRDDNETALRQRDTMLCSSRPS
jgi:hypothetical protein